MHVQNRLLSNLRLWALAFLLLQMVAAEIFRERDSLDNLYDDALMRPKIQRAPVMRLRFGRRSDPATMPQFAEKRWFSDVNQKPMRMKSLRLRFGRRSDPNIPLHSPFDFLKNEHPLMDNYNRDDEYIDSNDITPSFFDRIVRKPQRLRFGRSPVFRSQKTQQTGDDVMNVESVDNSLNDEAHNENVAMANHLKSGLNM